MPFPLTKEQVEDYYMSKSVMDEERSTARKFLDFLVGRTLEEQLTNTATGPLGELGLARIATFPELNSLVRYATQKGLGAKWFRGHSGSRPIEHVIREGFLPRASLQKYGEPLGVSLTSSPSVAQRFASTDAPIMRVAVLSKPNEVLDIGGFTIPGADVDLAHELYRLANRETFQQYRGGDLLSHAKELKKSFSPNPVSRALQSLPDAEKTQYNRLLSDILRDRGYNAIAYSPSRYGELELRVLDPKKAIPVGTVLQGGKDYTEVRIRPYHKTMTKDILRLYRKKFPEKFRPSDKGLRGDETYTVGEKVEDLMNDILSYGDLLAEQHTDRLRRIYYGKLYPPDIDVKTDVKNTLIGDLTDILRGKNTNKEILERFQDRYSILREEHFPGGTEDVHLGDILKRESPDWYMGKEAPTYRLRRLAEAGGTVTDDIEKLLEIPPVEVLNIPYTESPPEELIQKVIAAGKEAMLKKALK